MISILISDSQRLMAEALREALSLQKDFDLMPESPDTGHAAVEAVVRLAPDVALLDYWMEGMEGPAATRMVLKRDPNQKILLLCWFHGTHEITEGVQAGAWGVLSKSLELEQLSQAIRQVHSGMPLAGVSFPSATESEALLQPSEAWDRLVTLTPREIEILRHLAASGRPEIVAEELRVTSGTVRIHIQHILAKSGARSHVEAVVMARRHGLI